VYRGATPVATVRAGGNEGGMRVTQILRAIATGRPCCQHSARFPADRNKLFTACRKAVAQCQWDRLASDRDAGTIMAQTYASSGSHGEIIQIIVDEDSVVHARSQSLEIWYDRGAAWLGRNRDNIDELFYAIEKTLGARPLSPQASGGARERA
jgi:hypothetical protein